MKTFEYWPAAMAMLALTGWLAGPAGATLPEFDHYKIILDRKPFGEIAPPATTEVTPADAAAGSFSKDLELRAIIDEGGTIRVGLHDKRDNRGFYIAMGETVDQIELVSADYDAEEAVLRKGDEVIVFKLRPDQAAGAPAPAATTLAGLNQPATSPFQPAAGTAPTPPRRPFFAELKKRRHATTASTNQPQGFGGFFQPSGQAPTNVPAPFGPFTPVAGTNLGFTPFGAPPAGTPPAGATPFGATPDAGAPAPFFPFNPNPDAAPAHGQGETIENFLQQQQGNAGQLFQPADAAPFQFFSE